MYAKYTYAASSLVQNIMNDLIAMLTGTTDKATLSASCDQANTEILTTASTSNWAVHDYIDGTAAQSVAIAGCSQITAATLTFASGAATGDSGKFYFNLTNSSTTRTLQVYSDSAKTALVASGSRSGDGLISLAAQNSSGITGTATVAYTADDTDSGNIFYTLSRILKQPLLDDATKYMYVALNFATAGYALASMCESWNETNHAATNQVDSSSLSTVYSQRSNLANGGIFYVSASTAHMGFISYQSAVWGAISYNGPTIATQRTRQSAYDTVANAYPPTVLTYGVYNAGPRISNLAGSVDLITANARLDLSAGPWLYTAMTPITSVAIGASDKSARHLLLPMSFSLASAAFLGGECSSLNDIWMTTYNYGGGSDEVTVGANTYVIWPYATNYRLAVRKG